MQAESGGKVYKVDFGSEDHFPSCSCPHFQEHLLPCKHFFWVIKAGKAAWDDLPDTYREHPYLTLDPFALSKEVVQASQRLQEESEAEFIDTAEAEEAPQEPSTDQHAAFSVPSACSGRY